jgi:nucleolar complex protein 3
LPENKKISAEEEKNIVKIIYKMILKKRQLNQDIPASIARTIVDLLPKILNNKPFLLTMLFLLKQILAKYHKTQRMIDSDNDGFGLNSYNDKIEDPQATNAVNTSIYHELL